MTPHPAILSAISAYGTAGDLYEAASRANLQVQRMELYLYVDGGEMDIVKVNELLTFIEGNEQ